MTEKLNRHSRIFRGETKALKFLQYLLKDYPELDPEMTGPEPGDRHPRWEVSYRARPMLPKDGHTPQPGDRHWVRPEYHAEYGRHMSTYGPDFDRCCAGVFKDWAHYQCGRKATADPDYTGKPTRCKQHSRETAAKKQAAYDAKEAARKERDRFRRMADERKEGALGLVRKIAAGHNDPRGAAQEFLDRYKELDE